MKSRATCARARHERETSGSDNRNGNWGNGNENISQWTGAGADRGLWERESARSGLERTTHDPARPPPPCWLPEAQLGIGGPPGSQPAGSYLRQAFTLHMRLDPLQPVRVLLLPHPFVHLRAQLFRLLQGVLQVAVVRVVFGGVFQDLRRRTQDSSLRRCGWVPQGGAVLESPAEAGHLS